MPLINCKLNLVLPWPANCVMVSSNNEDQDVTFAITEAKFYVPMVPLSTQDNGKLLHQLKSGFKRTINWNKDTSKPELLRQNTQ